MSRPMQGHINHIPCKLDSTPGVERARPSTISVIRIIEAKSLRTLQRQGRTQHMDTLKAEIARKRAEQRAAKETVGDRYASKAALKAAKRSRMAMQMESSPTLPIHATMAPDDAPPESKRPVETAEVSDHVVGSSSNSGSAGAERIFEEEAVSASSGRSTSSSASSMARNATAVPYSSSAAETVTTATASSSSGRAAAEAVGNHAATAMASKDRARLAKPDATTAFVSRTVRSCMALSAAEFVDDPSELVYKFFRRLLVEWLQAVTKGEATARLPRSTPAEAEAAARQRRLLEQAAEFVRPLLHKAKYQLLDKDILEHVRKMVDKALQRRFREAGVHYMELAIGNSPWPIGVGSFGIHERPSRTQIRSENISREQFVLFRCILSFSACWCGICWRTINLAAVNLDWDVARRSDELGGAPPLYYRAQGASDAVPGALPARGGLRAVQIVECNAPTSVHSHPAMSTRKQWSG